MPEYTGPSPYRLGILFKPGLDPQHFLMAFGSARMLDASTALQKGKKAGLFGPNGAHTPITAPS